MRRIAGCAILVTFIWNRRCHSVISCARLGVPMEAIPFHWDPQLAPQIFRMGGGAYECHEIDNSHCNNEHAYYVALHHP